MNAFWIFFIFLMSVNCVEFAYGYAIASGNIKDGEANAAAISGVDQSHPESRASIISGSGTVVAATGSGTSSATFSNTSSTWILGKTENDTMVAAVGREGAVLDATAGRTHTTKSRAKTSKRRGESSASGAGAATSSTVIGNGSWGSSSAGTGLVNIFSILTDEGKVINLAKFLAPHDHPGQIAFSGASAGQPYFPAVPNYAFPNGNFIRNIRQINNNENIQISQQSKDHKMVKTT